LPEKFKSIFKGIYTDMQNIFLLISAFFFMEFVAWSNHKYIMHGFLWRWHKDHHVNDLRRPDDSVTEHKGFEKNDLFFLIYAIPAIILMIVGFGYGYIKLVYVAVGISLYGMTYFIIHDVIYHKRIKAPFFQKNHNRYIKAVINAHRGHHKPVKAADFHSYGLLIFPKRYFKI
jgi:beta-carotene 3-hydroxylase